MADWIKKQGPNIYWLQEINLTDKDNIGFGWKDVKKFSRQMNPKSRQEYLFSYDKIDFKLKLEETKRITSY
jgi:hypothetical protein